MAIDIFARWSTINTGFTSDGLVADCTSILRRS